MSKLEKYSSYKDSGVEWLEDIPEEWEVRRLKNIAKINNKSLPDNTDKNLLFDYVDIGSVTYENGIINTERFSFKSAPSRARRITQSGDTVISTVRTYLKAIDYVNDKKSKFIYSTGFAIIEPNNFVYTKFLTYGLRSNAFTNQVDIYSKGMSYPAINSSEISKLIVFLPPKQEQIKIASFLDIKTEQLDKAIKQKERLIMLLKERRQILINDAVTKGIDKTVAMKDSNFKWFGKVPAHWEVKALKYILEERIERTDTGDETLFMMSQIHGLVVRSDYHDKAVVAQSSIGNKKVYKNDLVFNKLKAHLGVFSKSNINEVGIVSPDYAVYYTTGNIENVKYLEYLFKTQIYISHFISKATGVVEGLIRLYTDDLFSLKVPVPPKTEQKAILEYIEVNNQKIDKAIDLQQQQITKLKEYKTTLIDSLVTGKVRVV